jgi:hypothetical protein
MGVGEVGLGVREGGSEGGREGGRDGRGMYACR